MKENTSQREKRPVTPDTLELWGQKLNKAAKELVTLAQQLRDENPAGLNIASVPSFELGLRNIQKFLGKCQEAWLDVDLVKPGQNGKKPSKGRVRSDADEA